MIRLKRLRILRYRDLRPGTELRFGDGFNMLLGKNAGGKTTLLNLISAITNDDLSPLSSEEDGFELEYDLADGGEVLTVAIDRRHQPRQGGLISPAREPFVETASFRLARAATEEQWTPRDGMAPPAVEPLWLAIHLLDRKLSSLAAGLLAYTTSHCPRLDEATSFLDLVVKNGQVPLVSEGGKTTSSSLLVPSIPRGIVDEIARCFDRADSSNTHELLPDIEVAPPLDRCCEMLGFQKVLTSARVKSQDVKGKEITTTYGDFAFRFRRPNQTEVRYENLSFGQKRLFGFLWYAATRGENAPVVADELANGMHHEWIRECIAILTETQSFLATQHPLLLDYLPEDATFIRCGTDSDGRLVWENFSSEQATKLAEGRQRGVMQLSEILQAEALW